MAEWYCRYFSSGDSGFESWSGEALFIPFKFHVSLVLLLCYINMLCYINAVLLLIPVNVIKKKCFFRCCKDMLARSYI